MGTEGVEEGFLHEYILCNLMAIICVDIATRIRIIQTGDENQILIPGSSSCRNLSIFRWRFVKLLFGRFNFLIIHRGGGCQLKS